MVHLAHQPHWFSDLVIILCGYEVIAVTTGRVPTLTAIQQKYRMLGPVIIIGVAVHFYNEDLKWLKRFRPSGKDAK